MEKNKEAIKKPCSDLYESKKIGISKTNLFKNNAHISVKSDSSKNKVSYVSRNKNAQNPIEKKYGFYSSDTKAFLKHSCDKCGIKPSSRLVVNAISGDLSTDESKIESGPDLNGNLSFNAHQTLCNFACSVPEISNFNKVLNYQSNRHNELPLPRCAKHKQRTVFSEQRTYNSKVTNNSSNSFASSKLPTVTDSNIRLHCSKNASWKITDTDSYFKISTDKAASECVTVTDKCNSKCEIKYAAVSDTLSKDKLRLTDLPVLVHPNLPKDSCISGESGYCVDDKFRIIKKQRKRLSRKWDQTSTASAVTVSSGAFDETDKMLFPALPSNSHSQQVKLNSSRTSSMPPSEHSSAENSDLESVHSLPGGSVNYTAPSPLSTSMSSTIPQASYADVIRMSASSTGVQGFLASDYGKTSPEQNFLTHTLGNSLQDRLQKDDNIQLKQQKEENIQNRHQKEENNQHRLQKDETIHHRLQKEESTHFRLQKDENIQHRPQKDDNIQHRPQKDENQSGSSDWVISRLSQLDQNSSDAVNSVSLTHSNQNGQNFVAPRPIVVSLEKPSFYNSSLQTNKNVLSALASHTNLPSPDRKVTENENLILDCLCSLEKISVDKLPMLSGSASGFCASDLTSTTNVQGTSIKTDSVYSSPSSVSSLSDAFKPADNRVLNVDNFLKAKDPPVIIMNNCSPPESMSEISFGIEYDEMVKLCADSCDVSIKNASSLTSQDAGDCCFSEESIKTDDTDLESSKAHILTETSSVATMVESEPEAATNRSISIGGKKLYWKDLDVDYRSNHVQLAEYFACVWEEFEKDVRKNSEAGENVTYFHEM